MLLVGVLVVCFVAGLASATSKCVSGVALNPQVSPGTRSTSGRITHFFVLLTLVS